MIDTFFQSLAFPKSCHLGKRVFKKLFVENAPLTAVDKKSMQNDVDGIMWQYTLKPTTIPIKAYEDSEREYIEVAVLEVAMKNQRSCTRLAEVIHRAIPYPLLVVFSFENSCSLSVAPKRFNQAEKGAIVVEKHFTTDWIDLGNPTAFDQAFLDSLAVSELPHTHFLALYSGWVNRFIARECAMLSGTFQIAPKSQDHEERRQRLAACHELEARIAELKASLRKELQFNRQVELNTKIKTTEKQLQQLAATL